MRWFLFVNTTKLGFVNSENAVEIPTTILHVKTNKTAKEKVESKDILKIAETSSNLESVGTKNTVPTNITRKAQKSSIKLMKT